MPISSTCRLLSILFAAASIVSASAESRRPPDISLHLRRCTDVPDAEACRTVIRSSATAKEKSTAYTYLAEADGITEPIPELLEKALHLDPNNALAKALISEPLPATGGSLGLLEAVRLRPEWKSLYMLAAEKIHTNWVGDYTPLLEAWKQAVARDPKVAATHVGLANALQNTENLPGAFREFSLAVSLDPAYLRAEQGLCLTGFRTGQGDRVEKACRYTIDYWNSNDWDDLRTLAAHLEQGKAYDLALAATERGLSIDPTNDFLRTDEYRLLYLLKRGAEGDERLHQYVEAHPQDMAAMGEYADALYANGELEKAEALYLDLAQGSSVKLDPSLGGCLLPAQVAMAALRLGKYDTAFEYLRRSLLQQPNCPNVLQQFTHFLDERSDRESLHARLDRTSSEIEATVVKERTPDVIGDYYADRQNWPNAAEYFRKALNDPGITKYRNGLHWELGRALVESGQYCAGLAEINLGRKQNPIYENGRLGLTSALAKAEAKCAE